MTHCKLLLFTFLCLALCISVVAHAESILIRTKSGVEGQGWLFGAHAGEKCWIAVPAHVVTSPETGSLTPFYFFDSRDNTGESAMPVAAVSDMQSSVVSREASDLAFARVLEGRSDGQCRSRLGLPLYTYQAILGKRDGFSVSSMHKTSFGTFDVTLDRKSVDSHGGATIDFVVEDVPTNKQFLRKGLSGATVATVENGKVQPVAMVIRVLEDDRTLRALRYDYIKDLFFSLRWPDDPAYRQGADDGSLDYKVVHAKYLPLAGDAGVDSLKSDAGCWKASAHGGQRMVELVIEVRDANARIETLHIHQSEQCNGQPVKYLLDQRSSSRDAWVHITSGISQYGDEASCRIALSGPRQFRIRMEATQPITLSGLRLR